MTACVQLRRWVGTDLSEMHKSSPKAAAALSVSHSGNPRFGASTFLSLEIRSDKRQLDMCRAYFKLKHNQNDKGTICVIII